MVVETHGRRIRRILVALDASPTSLDALHTAARLARVLEAELDGLFVEDTDLLSFAELPFAALTGALLGRSHRVAEGEVQRSLRAQAQRARSAVSSAAASAGVRWSFQVVRGNVREEVMNAAKRADLLSIGLVGASEPRRTGAGSVAHHAARAAPRSVLILRKVGPKPAPVVALAHAGVPLEPVLQAAGAAARASGHALIVLVPAEERQRRVFMAQAAPILAQLSKVRVRWHALPGDTADEALSEALRVARHGILVLDSRDPLLREQRLEHLVDRGGCSLLILR